MFSILQYQIAKHPSNIKYVDSSAFKPEEYAELWKIAIKADDAMFEKCPLRTYDQENQEITAINMDVCLYAVTLNGLLLKHLTPFMNTEDDIIRAALRQNPLAAEYVLDGFMEETETDIAVKQNGYALKWCKAFKKDPKYIDIALETNGEIIKELDEIYLSDKSYILKALKGKNKLQIKIDKKIYGKFENDEEVVEHIVTVDGLLLDNFPHFNKNKKIVEAALKESPFALEYVDSSFVTREVVLDCIKRDGESIKYALQYRLEFDLVKIAVQQAGLALEWLPEYGNGKMKHSREVVLMAVRQEGLALRYAPFFSGDRGIAYEAIKHNGLAVRYADEKFYTEREFVEYAVDGDPVIIGLMKINSNSNEYVLPHTEENARLAVKYYGWALYHCKEFANVIDIVKCAILHSSVETNENVVELCSNNTLKELAKDYEIVKKICGERGSFSKSPAFKQIDESYKKIAIAHKNLLREYIDNYASERDLLELIEMNIKILKLINPLKLVKNPRLGRWHCVTKFKNQTKLLTYKDNSINSLSTLDIKCNLPYL